MQSLPGGCQVGTGSHACASSLKLAKSKVIEGRLIHFGNKPQQGSFSNVEAAIEGIRRLSMQRNDQGKLRPIACSVLLH